MGHTNVDYVIVGAGMAGAAAARGIRQEDSEGSILLIGREPDAPYNRTTLSKHLWREPETTTLETIPLEGPDLPGVDTRLSTTVTAVDPEAHTVTTDAGDTVTYGRLILATGGTTRHPGIELGPRIFAYHDLADYRALRAFADAGAHVLVVGGGFIGSEISAVLSETPATVSYAFPGTHIGQRQFPAEIATHLDGTFTAHDVELMSGVRIVSAADTGSSVHVTFDNKLTMDVDAVVLGLGEQIDTSWIEAAGIAVDGGVLVDEHRRTSDPDIFAAGDIASVPLPAFGRHRIEHEDAAVTGGELAGRNAAGAEAVDGHLPFFYSDLYEDGYEALGRLSSSLETVIDWKVEDSEAVVYYLDSTHVLRGVLLWNVWGDDDHDTKAIAADLLADHSPKVPEDLIGKI